MATITADMINNDSSFRTDSAAIRLSWCFVVCEGGWMNGIRNYMRKKNKSQG